MLPDEVEMLAQELLAAAGSGQTVPSLPSSRPGFDLDAAYAVEVRLKSIRESGGHRTVGLKVGYANKAMWRVFKLDTLVWAHMYDDTVHYSSNNTARLAIPHARSLKVEPEMIFGLKQPMAAGFDAASALACVDWLALGFEIIDCPFPGWQFQPADFVASFGLHAALVVGEKLHVQPDSIAKLVEDLARFTVRMSKNNEFVEEGSGKNSLRSPALCLAELGAAVLRRFPDEGLQSADIVSSGTLTGGHATTAGDHWKCEVQGLALPSLTLDLG